MAHRDLEGDGQIGRLAHRLAQEDLDLGQLVAGHVEDELVVVVQTYTRVASLMRASLERALRKLGIEQADLLLLGWWNKPIPARIRA